MLRSLSVCFFFLCPLYLFSMNDLEEKTFAELIGPKSPDYEVIDTTASAVWEKYKESAADDAKRLQEHKKMEIHYNGKVMRYGMKKVGKKDDNGIPLYIALHGGGGAPARVNDSQWNHMKVYYLSSVKQGIYIAPRGITNTWNLHFVNDSYAMYDRLIENMILFEGVDPNRVYILGFSAGGDGTYQIAPRMADRWAAANMSAGHHNGVSPRNLYNVPFLIQVGARDTAFKRHHEGVNYGQKILKFQKMENGGYLHKVNIHAGRGHNFLDNHPKEPMQKIMANPLQWKNTGKSAYKDENTNAIRWLSQHVRDPLPKRVIWDLKTGADRSAKELWKSNARGKRSYWLGLKDKAEGEIIASYDKKANSVKVEKAVSGMIIYLNQKMLNLNSEIKFDVEGTKLALKPDQSVKNLAITAQERGDINYMFEGAVIVNKKDGKWEIEDF